MQKWTNKSLVVECVKDLYAWIRAGPTSKEERIKYLRTLRSCSDESEGKPTEDGIKCQTLVIEALLKYSKGKKGAKVFPYGDRAAKYTEDFVQIPSPTFAITLACMYPFIVQDEETHPIMLKRAQYPIKQLWPKSVLKRYLNFNDAVWEQRNDMMDNYEASGGVYHGEDEEDMTLDEEDEVEEKEYEDMTLECDKDF